MNHSPSETELTDSVISIKAIQPFELRLLTQSVTKPSFFINIIGYEVLEHFVCYKCEINVLRENGETIDVKFTRTRYSILLDLYNNVRNSFVGVDLPSFPPKIWFNNRNEQVAKDRMIKLQPFINSLNKIPNITSNAIFNKVFGKLL